MFWIGVGFSAEAGMLEGNIESSVEVGWERGRRKYV